MKNCLMRKRNHHQCLLFVFLLLFNTLLGCDQFKKTKVIPPIDETKRVERLSLDRGYNLFFNGDIEMAASIFKSQIQSQDRDISDNARFAFMCANLILDKSAGSMQTAKIEMAKLLEMDSVTLDANNLKILNQVLKHLERQLKEAKRNEPNLDERCAYQYRQSLKLKNEKIDELNHENKELKKEISSLKNKIKSIEEIDQKIQEKKNPDKHRKIF